MTNAVNFAEVNEYLEKEDLRTSGQQKIKMKTSPKLGRQDETWAEFSTLDAGVRISDNGTTGMLKVENSTATTYRLLPVTFRTPWQKN
jgi:hypothetical protein